MVIFETCSCRPNGTVLDLLQCAPCPPPMLRYSEFHQHALNRTLCLAEVCNIARRCRPEDPDVGHDCFPESTTHDGTTESSSHTTGHSIFTTDFSASTTDYTTEFKTGSPVSAAACNSTCLLISICSVIAVCIVVAIVILGVTWKRRKVKNKNNANNGEKLETTAARKASVSEGMEADINIVNDNGSNYAMSLCNIPENNSDERYTEKETNLSDIDQPDSKSEKDLDTQNDMDDVTDTTEDAFGDHPERKSFLYLETKNQTNGDEIVTCDEVSEREAVVLFTSSTLL